MHSLTKLGHELHGIPGKETVDAEDIDNENSDPYAYCSLFYTFAGDDDNDCFLNARNGAFPLMVDDEMVCLVMGMDLQK